MSKVNICKMAVSGLGSDYTVNNIDTPKTKEEKVFSVWYDPSRQVMLKNLKPNFAVKRSVRPKSTQTNPFGYAYLYQLPSDCLQVLGIGDIQDKEKNYTVEGGFLATDTDYTNGLNLRYLADITDTAKFSSEFEMGLAIFLRAQTAIAITQDKQKKAQADNEWKEFSLMISSLSAQENPPIRVSHSRYEQAKNSYRPTTGEKK